MEEKDLWTTFEKTGSVSDYLNYKGCYGGENTSESDNHGNGNDSVRDTYGRI